MTHWQWAIASSQNRAHLSGNPAWFPEQEDGREGKSRVPTLQVLTAYRDLKAQACICPQKQMLQTTCNFIISNTYFTNVFISIHNTYTVLSTTIFPIVSEFTDPLYILRLTYSHIESIQYCLLQYCYISQTFLFPHLLSSVLNKVHTENLWYLTKSQFLHNITEQIRNFK